MRLERVVSAGSRHPDPAQKDAQGTEADRRAGAVGGGASGARGTSQVSAPRPNQCLLLICMGLLEGSTLGKGGSADAECQ